MDQLWAPWRSSYVQRDEETNTTGACFLCEAGAQVQPDRATLVVACSQHSVVLLNRFPYSAGHLMVVPRRHAANIGVLSDEEYTDLMHCLRRTVSVVEHVFRPHGVNVGLNLGTASGAGVPDHLHLHVVPRWEGDTNFMTVVSQTRVISQDLMQTWEQVSSHFVSGAIV